VKSSYSANEREEKSFEAPTMLMREKERKALTSSVTRAPTTSTMVKERGEERHPFKFGEVYQRIAPCGIA